MSWVKKANRRRNEARRYKRAMRLYRAYALSSAELQLFTWFELGRISAEALNRALYAEATKNDDLSSP